MALISTETDPWITEYDACEKTSRELMEFLSQLEILDKRSNDYNAISGKIRVRLSQSSSELKQLKQKLNYASVVSTITPGELERRKRQVENLESKQREIQERFNRNYNDNLRTQSSTSRGATFGDAGTVGWGEIGEDEDTVVHTTPDLKQQQHQVLKQQDEGLEVLSQIITRQKQISTSINNEITEQNEILDDIAEGMDRTDDRIRGGTQMIHVVQRKDAVCGYWVIIVLLFIAIVAVALA